MNDSPSPQSRIAKTTEVVQLIKELMALIMMLATLALAMK